MFLTIQVLSIGVSVLGKRRAGYMAVGAGQGRTKDADPRNEHKHNRVVRSDQSRRRGPAAFGESLRGWFAVNYDHRKNNNYNN